MSLKARTIALITSALAVAAVPAMASARPVETTTCARQSTARFPAAGASDVVVGPLRFVGLRDMRRLTAEELREHGGFKSPFLLAVGHSATVSVDQSSRAVARLSYLHYSDREPFENLPHTVRFRACRDIAGRTSYTGGKPVTFWSGFFVLTRLRVCLSLTVRVDGGRAHRLRLPVGRVSCGRR